MSERPSAQRLRALVDECAAEPIHRLGAIQPHGYLVGASSGGRVSMVSANVAELLEVDVGALLGRPLEDVIESLELDLTGSWFMRSGQTYRLRRFRDVEQGDVFVEVEPTHEPPLDAARVLSRASDHLRAARNLTELSDRIASVVRDVTGFDRVMVYRFDESYNGTVVAEDRMEGIDSFHGLTFPASDIPAQARALYLKNWVRSIADVDAVPVSIVGVEGAQAPDLSMSQIRSVSPVHLEYLRNMKVAASMSLSIVIDGALWGLIACHHLSQRRITPDRRGVAELMARMMSLEVGHRRAQDEQAKAQQVARFRRDIQEYAQHADRFTDVFTHSGPAIMGLTGAKGACVAIGDDILTVGGTPDRSHLKELVQTLRLRGGDPVLATDDSARALGLPGLGPEAAGLLCCPLSADGRDLVIWFRPARHRTTVWAGNPKEKVSKDEAGVLHPRNSFAQWTEVAGTRSEPWTPAERATGREFSWYMGEVLSQRLEALKRLSTEREQRLKELDSFAYLAAHDLREPIRGVDAYLTFAREALEQGETDEAWAHLDKIQTLIADTDDMLLALLEYARASSVRPRCRPVDLGIAVDRAQEALVARLVETAGTIVVESPARVVECDPLLVQEVFLNLLSNGLKYGGPRPTVRVAWSESARPEEQVIVSVADRGIGIAPGDAQATFEPFRRLHPSAAFGGGSGCGLSIARALVERHGGRMWLESELGKGTTFFFTIGKEASE